MSIVSGAKDVLSRAGDLTSDTVSKGKAAGKSAGKGLMEKKDDLLGLSKSKTVDPEKETKIQQKLLADQARREKSPQSKKFRKCNTRIDHLEQRLAQNKEEQNGDGMELVTTTEIGANVDVAGQALRTARQLAENAEKFKKNKDLRANCFRSAEVQCLQAQLLINKQSAAIKKSADQVAADKKTVNADLQQSIKFFEESVKNAASASPPVLKDAEFAVARKTVKLLWQTAINAGDKQDQIATVKKQVMDDSGEFARKLREAQKSEAQATRQKTSLDAKFQDQLKQGQLKPSHEKKFLIWFAVAEESLKERNYAAAEKMLGRIEKTQKDQVAWDQSQSQRAGQKQSADELQKNPELANVGGKISRALEMADEAASRLDFKQARNFVKDAQHTLDDIPNITASRQNASRLQDEYSRVKGGAKGLNDRFVLVKSQIVKLAKAFGGEAFEDARAYAKEYLKLEKGYDNEILSLQTDESAYKATAQHFDAALTTIEDEIQEALNSPQTIYEGMEEVQNDKAQRERDKESLELEKAQKQAIENWKQKLAAFRMTDKNLNALREHGDQEVRLILTAVDNLEKDFTQDITEKCLSVDAISKQLLDIWDDRLETLATGVKDRVKTMQAEIKSTKEEVGGLTKDVAKQIKEKQSLVNKVMKTGAPPSHLKKLAEEAEILEEMSQSENLDTLQAAKEALEKMKTHLENVEKNSGSLDAIVSMLKTIKDNLDKDAVKDYCPKAHDKLKKEYKALKPEAMRDCDQQALSKVADLDTKVWKLKRDADSIKSMTKDAEQIIEHGKKVQLVVLDKLIEQLTDGKYAKYKGKFRDQLKEDKQKIKNEDPDAVKKALKDLKFHSATMDAFVKDIGLNKKGKTEELVKDHKDTLDTKAKEKDEHLKQRKDFLERYDILKEDLRQLREAIVEVGGDSNAVDRAQDEADKAWGSYTDSRPKKDKLEAAKTKLKAANTQLKTARAMIRELTNYMMGSEETRKGLLSTLGPRWQLLAKKFHTEVVSLKEEIEKGINSPDQVQLNKYLPLYDPQGQKALSKVLKMFKPKAHVVLIQQLKVLADEQDDGKRRAAREAGLQFVRRYLKYVDANPIFMLLVKNQFEVRLNPGRVRKLLKDLRLNLSRCV